MAKALRRLDYFKLKLQFLATKNCAQVELPKPSSESESGPVLVEVYDELHT